MKGNNVQKYASEIARILISCIKKSRAYLRIVNASLLVAREPVALSSFQGTELKNKLRHYLLGYIANFR